MLYFKCPTCRTLLANKQLIYEERLAKICDNSSKSQKEKDEEKKKLLDSLELWRPCCRMRIMGYIKLIDIIK
jgi:DNA-directed RNA polymerase subunit N (RpoN/RPB10)